MGFYAYLGFLFAASRESTLAQKTGSVSVGKSFAWLGVWLLLFILPLLAFKMIVSLDNSHVFVQMAVKNLSSGWLMFSLFGLSENLSRTFGLFSSSYTRSNEKYHQDDGLTLIVLQD